MPAHPAAHSEPQLEHVTTTRTQIRIVFPKVAIFRPFIENFFSRDRLGSTISARPIPNYPPFFALRIFTSCPAARSHRGAAISAFLAQFLRCDILSFFSPGKMRNATLPPILMLPAFSSFSDLMVVRRWSRRNVLLCLADQNDIADGVRLHIRRRKTSAGTASAARSVR